MRKLKFKIGSLENAAHELKKTLELQLSHVSSLYESPLDDPAEAIHETRLSYKKCRAILRLIRDAMGYAAYYRENKGLRDMQRDLSGIRDLNVQYSLLLKLSKNYPEFTMHPWFTCLIKEAKTRHDLELNNFLRTDQADKISSQIKSMAAQIQYINLTGEGFDLIEGGLSRMYRQGKEMGRMVFSEEADADEIHTFRKKAKYLQYQLSYLRTLFKPVFKAMTSTMEELTENLGYYNDLQLASAWIKEFAEDYKKTRINPETVINKLEIEMQKALTNSRPVYEKMYAEKPGQFNARIRSYWESHSKRQSE